MENGWMENGLSECGKWMWKVDVESGKWRGSGSHTCNHAWQLRSNARINTKGKIC